MRVVRLRQDGGEVRISFGYDPYLVEMVKSLPGRKFHSASKTWTVPDTLANVRRFFEANGVQVVASGERQEPRDESPRWSSLSWADKLLGACGDELATKVFRTLSKVLHPDVGGDQQLMSELIAARERTKKKGAA